MGNAHTSRGSIEIHAGDVASEFPDYPLDELPNLCNAWQDKSWHNDICPSFVTTLEDAGRTFLAVLWCEYPDPAVRELPGQARLAVVIYDVTGDEDREAYYRGDEAFTACGETVNELIRELTGEAAEVAYLLDEGGSIMERTRLHNAVEHRCKLLAATKP